MALSTIKNAEKIVAADINDNTVEFGAQVQKPGPICTWWIEVIAGSFQFAADEAVIAGHHTWAAGSKIPMTIHKTLHFKAASITGEHSFVVTV